MAKKAFVYDGSQWVDIAQSTADLTNYPNMTTTPISGFRNDIINGDFKINQRGFTSTTTTGTYGLDRWYLETNTGTSTYSTQSFTLGNVISGYEPTNFARIVTSGQSATGSFSLLTQQIEDVRNLAGQTAVVSFWAKAASGTPKVAVTLDQLFGSGGSPSSAVNNLFGTVTLSTSWTRYTLTSTVASISGKTIGTTANTSALRLRLWVSGGSDLNPSAQSIGAQNNTFDFWGVQVEPGTIATPFEQRPIGTELSLCQRYYEVGVTPAQFMAMPSASFVPSTYRSVYYKVNKRISNPVVTVVCTNHDNASGNGTVLGTSDSAFVHVLLVANTSFPYNTAQLNWNSNAEL